MRYQTWKEAFVKRINAKYKREKIQGKSDGKICYDIWSISIPTLSQVRKGGNISEKTIGKFEDWLDS